MLSCPLLPPSWSSLPPLAFTLQSGSGMSGPQLRGWHTAVPTALWDRAYGGSGGQRTGAPCTKQHPLPLCLPCGWCRSSPGHQGTAGDTETCPSFLPTSPSSPSSPVLWWRVHSTARTDPRVSSTHHSSAALSPKGTRAERSDGPSSAARPSPGGEQELASARGLVAGRSSRDRADKGESSKEATKQSRSRIGGRMGKKTTVPIPHLIECFHMKQGRHQDSGS